MIIKPIRSLRKFHDNFHLNGGILRKYSHAHCRTRVRASLAENLPDEIGSTINNCSLLNKARCRRNETHDLNYAGDTIESNKRVDRCESIKSGGACIALCVFDRDVRTHFARGWQNPLNNGQLPGRPYLVAYANSRNIRCKWLRNLRERVSKFGESRKMTHYCSTSRLK